MATTNTKIGRSGLKVGTNVLDNATRHKVKEILFKIPILTPGWEMDHVAWAVKFEDGGKAIVGTNHNIPTVMTPWDLERHQKQYEEALLAVKKAIGFLVQP